MENFYLTRQSMTSCGLDFQNTTRFPGPLFWRYLATKWLCTYNNEHPHTAIGGIPPWQLLEAA
jgi:transposase InsO family protein